MSEVLEATMLICFGASWPISVIKNIKSKTAKSMSLQFILLIIGGYIAGITAKLISHRINYVLVVYLFNLIVVSINVGVYFYNKKLDRERELSGAVIIQEGMDMNAETAETHEYTSDEKIYTERRTSEGII